jgi:hypothetical protein
MRPKTTFAGDQIGVDVERCGDSEREVVPRPGAVSILAVEPDGCMTLVRRPRGRAPTAARAAGQCLRRSLPASAAAKVTIRGRRGFATR